MKSMMEDIIDDALWAPTPDNIQNWKIQYFGQRLNIEVDTQKGQHPLDPYHHASILSLGAICEYVEIACAQRGLQVAWSTSGPNQLGLTFEISKTQDPSPKLVELYPFLKLRATDRRPYTNEIIPKEVLDQILMTNQHYKSTVGFKRTPSKEFFKYLRKSDVHFLREPDIIEATLKWVDFKNPSPKIGLSGKNLGLDPLDLFVFKLFAKSPTILSLAQKMGLASFTSYKTLKAYKKSGGFLLFSAKTTHLDSLFDVGRHATRCWLMLSRFGLAAQPLSFASLSCFSQKINGPISQYIDKNKDHFKKGSKILNDEFLFPPQGLPCWLFRIGKGQPMPLEMRLSRLQAKDFVTSNKESPIFEEPFFYPRPWGSLPTGNKP